MPIETPDDIDGEGNNDREGRQQHLLWVGRIIESKRLEFLFKVAKRFPDVMFDVVGTPNVESEYYQGLVSEAEKLKNVQLHGRVAEGVLPALYKQSTLLLCTSVLEGFPTTFLEAWSYGTPVVTTFDPDGVVKENELGMVVGDEEEMEAAIHYFVNDKELYDSYASRVKGFFRNNYTFDAILPKYKDFFQTLHGFDMNKKSRTPVEHFNDRANSWHLLYKKAAFKQRMQLFVGSVEEIADEDARILDFGCGAGNIAIELAKRGYNVTGVDAAERMIESSKNNAEQQGVSNVEFIKIDPRGDSLDSEKYNFVVCSSVIEYIRDDELLLKNLYRSLLPGGHLFISVPNAHSLLGQLEDVAANIGVRREKKIGEAAVKYAVRRYKKAKFINLIKQCGYEYVSHNYFECPYLGKVGKAISGLKYVGVLLFVHGQKKA
jgi:2-polyprenyl-3-methyl-5-hydroxy-6-metoxy-1,4-benzoquinol methylase